MFFFCELILSLNKIILRVSKSIELEGGLMKFSIEPCNKLYALNKAVVGEIDFSRTVLFSSEIDLTEIEKLRAQSFDGEKPSYTALIAKAVALALLEFPYANRRIYNLWGIPFLSFFQSFIGTDIAVAIERNVENYHAVAYIEVIRNAHKKTPNQLSSMLRSFSNSDLKTSEQWKSFYRLGMYFPLGLGGFIAKLPLYFPKMWTNYRGGAALISSPAKYGVDAVVAAWTHPISFSFGLAQKKPMVKNDKVVAVPAFTFVMNWDRRVMAGAQAARFFARICELLRDAEQLQPGYAKREQKSLNQKFENTLHS